MQQLISPPVIQRKSQCHPPRAFYVFPPVNDCERSLEEVIPLPGFSPWQIQKIRDDLDNCLWPIDAGIPKYFSLSMGTDDVIHSSTPPF